MSAHLASRDAHLFLAEHVVCEDVDDSGDGDEDAGCDDEGPVM